MIHTIMLVNRETKEILVKSIFWKVLFGDGDLLEFFTGLIDIEASPSIGNTTPIFVGEYNHRVFHRTLMDGKLILLFWTDGKDEDRVINSKILQAAANVVAEIREDNMAFLVGNFRQVLGETALTKLKVCFVGSGGVGKTTLFKLLFGRAFTYGYSPSSGVTISGDTFDFGTFRIHLWDFPGQAVFHEQWDFLLQGTDAIFLVTDSSFMNVIKTKGLLKKIRGDAPAVPIFIVANKQDLPESIQAMKIQRLLGQKTIPMIAAAKLDEREKYREFFLDVLLDIACNATGIEKPELSVKDVILVSGEEVTSLPVEIEDSDWSEIEESRPIAFLLLSKTSDGKKLLGHINYNGLGDVSDFVDLISALDSKEVLDSIEYGKHVVFIESTEHFMAVFMNTNKREEATYRQLLKQLVEAIEFIYVGDEVVGGVSYEKYILDWLIDVPLMPLDQHHVLKTTGVSPIEFRSEVMQALSKHLHQVFEEARWIGDVIAEEKEVSERTFYSLLQMFLRNKSLAYVEPEL